MEDIPVMNSPAISSQAKLLNQYKPSDVQRIGYLLCSIECNDLTTLSGDDTESNVERLCVLAANPLPLCVMKKISCHTTFSSKPTIKAAAVCVYPRQVAVAKSIIDRMGVQIPIASVATGFPAGQTSIEDRLSEIRYCIENGANEIDVVINRSAALRHEWKVVHDEIVSMKKQCGTALLKVILAVGELGDLNNIYKASRIAMDAGADFIKTSTGKEVVNANIPAGIVMCRAIVDHYLKTGVRVGLKPAGGIRTCKDALLWMHLIQTELGHEWLKPELFRIGASGLLKDIQKELFIYFNGVVPAERDLSII